MGNTYILGAISALPAVALGVIFALPAVALRTIFALPAGVLRFISTLPAGAFRVISQLVQERFQNMICLLIGAFLGLLCNFNLESKVGVILQTTVIAVVLPLITSALSMFTNEWKQVASRLRANVFEIAIRLVLKLEARVGISSWIRKIVASRLTTALESVLASSLFQHMSSMLSPFTGDDSNISSSLASALSSNLVPDFSSILPSYTGNDSNSSSAPERTHYQIAKERLSACIMGVILGTFVHLTITVYSFSWTMSQVLIDKYHLSNILYSAFVAVLSIAAALV